MIPEMKNINNFAYVHPQSVHWWRQWQWHFGDIHPLNVTHVIICKRHFGNIIS